MSKRRKPFVGQQSLRMAFIDGLAEKMDREIMALKTETMESRLLKLLSRQWVTPLDALSEVNCLSLAQRVSEFIREGHTVHKAWVNLPSGKKVRSYRLARAKK